MWAVLGYGQRYIVQRYIVKVPTGSYPIRNVESPGSVVYVCLTAKPLARVGRRTARQQHGLALFYCD